MRHGRGRMTGWIAVIVGTIIFLALILPQWLWWLVCALTLIWGGIWLLKC